MQQHTRWIPLALIGMALLVAGCGGSSGSDEAATGPATVYEVEGTDLKRIELTEAAAERLDIQTMPVERNGSGTVIPYAAVFYSPTGETWAYVSPRPLTFVRRAIVVEHIDGDRAILSKGPTPGTNVVTVGVVELYGVESGLGE